MVCVPGGPFMRGGSPALPGEGDPSFESLPLAEVRVSSFFLDRYAVTNRRYAMCVDAGVCPVPLTGSSWRSPERAELPFTSVSYADATTFCAFDGGRLATEAEWEKAARGPSPDLRERPWEPRGMALGLWDCDVLPVATSPCFAPTPGYGLDSVRAFPGAASPFGAELMVGGVPEWVFDWRDQMYYGDPASRDDPLGPSSGYSRQIRGESRALVTASTRLSGRTPSSIVATGLRCARSAI